MGLIFLLLLGFSSLFSYDVFIINENFKKERLNQTVYYTKDNGQYTANDILHKQDMPALQKLFYFISKDEYWTKNIIRNESNQTIDFVLYKERTRLNNVDVYLFQKGTLVQTYDMGDLKPPTQKDFYSRFSLLKLTLLPNEEVTMVSFVQNNAVYELNWNIQTVNDYLEEEISSNLAWGIFAGMLVLAFFFNIFMYKVHAQTSYLIIALHSLVFIAFQYAEHGILYALNLNLDLKYNTTILFISTQLSSILLCLFPYYLFNVEKNYKMLCIIIKMLLLFYLFVFIGLMYSQFIDITYYKFFVSSILYTFFINSITLFLISLYMLYKNESGAIYYLFGQGTFAVCLSTYTLAFIGKIEYTQSIPNLLLIALISDMLLLMVAQYFRTRKQQDQLRRNKEILLEQSRFSSIGQAIGNITHQWKHPLTQIGSSVTLLEMHKKHKQEDFVHTFDEQIPTINKCISVMQKTLDEFNNFYSSKNYAEPFNVYNSIVESIEMLKAKQILTHTNIQVDVNKELQINSIEHVLSNIILILIDNSLEEFKEKTNNHIHIAFYHNQDSFSLVYKDNAGGIKVSPIEKVFDYFVSTKDDNQGMGLPILKMLVEEKLQGSITLKNTLEGVEFIIMFKSQQLS